MLLRQHPTETTTQAQGPGGNGPSAQLQSLRQAGESLFEAADGAIARALSGDSRAFLEATQQEGGQ
jgi:hypothetical protein